MTRKRYLDIEVEDISLVIRDLLVEHLPDFTPDLMCACAISSYTLCRALARHDIEATFVMGEMWSGPKGRSYGEHCWVQVGDTIVDLTARQFSPRLPPILVAPRTDPRYRPYKKGRAAVVEVNRDWAMHSPKALRTAIGKVLRRFESIS